MFFIAAGWVREIFSTKWLFNKVNSMIVTFELEDSPIVGELERSRTHHGLS